MSDGKNQLTKLPRVAITYCTQCRWMLRAAYFGQELLSTFGTSIGEIALIPATGGVFTVYLTYQPPTSNSSGQLETKELLIWDRKAEGGFPETKVLKQRVRNLIEPDKNLGHSDTPSSKVKANTTLEGDVVVKGDYSEPAANAAVAPEGSGDCKDCP